MNPPPAYRDAVMESQHYPSVATGVFHNRVRSLVEKLWKWEVRRYMGALQIIFGVTELILGILARCNPYPSAFDFQGWGIWNGVLAILAGCLGVSERWSKGVVRTYMVTSITIAILCVDCFIYAAIEVVLEPRILYTIMCIIFFIQTAISIIGASVTCRALWSTTDQAQQNASPPSYSQVAFENQQHQSVTQGLVDNTTRPVGIFRRINVRRIFGTVQIAIGGIELTLGIVVIFVPDFSLFFNQDYVGWGIWHGLFAIVSGSLGASSVRKKWVVIADAITSMITAVLCAGCVFYAVIKAILQSGYHDTRDTNLPIYIILGIVYLMQMVISVIGATLSCESMNIQPQQVMNPSNNPEVTWDSQHTSSMTISAVNNSARPDDKLLGGNVRRAMGALQIMFGGIECLLGIVFILFSDCFFFDDRKDYVGWAVSSVVFAIVSGLPGILSVKKTCMVRTYMMASITNAVLCVDGLVFVLIRGVVNRWYDSCNSFYLAIHISLCIALFIQVIISTIGASFSCIAVGSTTSQPQQAVEYTHLPLYQHRDIAPPYVEDESQSGLAYPITTPGADCTSEVPTIQSSF